MSKPTCCGTVIQNTALNKSFYVCTKCKQEVFETDAALQQRYYDSQWNTYPPLPSDFEQLELFPDWTTGSLSNNKDNQDNG